MSAEEPEKEMVKQAREGGEIPRVLGEFQEESGHQCKSPPEKSQMRQQREGLDFSFSFPILMIKYCGICSRTGYQ